MSPILGPVPAGVFVANVAAAKPRRRSCLPARRSSNARSGLERRKRLHPAQSRLLLVGSVRAKFVRGISSLGLELAQPRLARSGREKPQGRRRQASVDAVKVGSILSTFCREF